jgi:hypothetical protein
MRALAFAVHDESHALIISYRVANHNRLTPRAHFMATTFRRRACGTARPPWTVTGTPGPHGLEVRQRLLRLPRGELPAVRLVRLESPGALE